MDVLILLVPLSLAGVALAVVLFFRMSASGQFDDVEGPARSILLDDDTPRARTRRREGPAASSVAAGSFGPEASPLPSRNGSRADGSRPDPDAP